MDDLESGYWQLHLHPSMFQLCGVHYMDPNTGILTFWTWRVLFLGIRDAVFVFSHLPRPVVEYKRLVGWRGTIYIDDLSTLAPTFLQCQYWRFWATDLLAQAGWVFSESKRKDPSQHPILLGVLVDTLRGTFHVPQEKLDNMVTSMEEILLHRRVKARGLASVVGKLVAAYKSLGKDLVGLMTRDCYRAINSIGYNWDFFIAMTSGAKRELS